MGRASFSTDSKRYTILDAPGHKAYVPHMIGGAAQADIGTPSLSAGYAACVLLTQLFVVTGVLVISARKGEFEAGLDRGGQTREHAMLAKTAGVKQLIIVINKMDDPTVMWQQERCVLAIV